jgi:hypothetical protein
MPEGLMLIASRGYPRIMVQKRIHNSQTYMDLCEVGVMLRFRDVSS